MIVSRIKLRRKTYSVVVRRDHSQDNVLPERGGGFVAAEISLEQGYEDSSPGRAAP